MWPMDCIAKKRDGHALQKAEIERFIREYTEGTIMDYQAAAWCMAVFLQGMTNEETTYLTLAMAHSGDIVDLSSIPGVKVDKHSTGGIADTTTLIVAPLVAAAGVKVAKMSGRGLGFTGGTIDKLEAIPRFKTTLTEEDFLHQVKTLGLSVISQSGDIAPADKLLYSLRDATATVESIPLIASSIMSKKIASGADAIVLDVKYGDGAFMKTKERARQLADMMVSIGTLAHRPTRAILTSMEAPLGTAIGNSLEIDEAVDALSGRGSRRLMEVVMAIGTQMLLLGEKVKTEEEGKALLQSLIDSRKGLKKFKEFVKAQGGDTSWVGKKPLTKAEQVYTAICTDEGYIHHIDGRALGDIAMTMGAGRAKKEDAIDPMVGIRLFKELGDEVHCGDLLFKLYAKKDAPIEELAQRVASHIEVRPDRLAPPVVVSEIITP